jgi:hypothetical protein
MITPATDCDPGIGIIKDNIKKVCSYSGSLGGPGDTAICCMVDDSGFFHFTDNPSSAGINTENSG